MGDHKSNVPSYAEVKEDIYHFLKRHVDGTISEEQAKSNLQTHSIVALSYKEEKGYTREEKELAQRRYLEVLQELKVLGIVAPRREHEFFFITEKGHMFLLEQSFDIHDPDQYLASLPAINSISKKYIKESIYCFNKNYILASVVMLGISSEGLILELAQELATRSGNSTIAGYLNATTSKIANIIDEIDNICQTERVPRYSHYKTSVFSLAHYIRYYRNQHTHPTDVTISYSDAYALLNMYKKYTALMMEFKNIISSHTF